MKRFCLMACILTTILVAFTLTPLTASAARSHVRPLTSCNTAPNNANCDGQPTPGGCANSITSQGIDEGVQDNLGYNIADVYMVYSTHCYSNYGIATKDGSPIGIIYYLEIQRASGPDGGALDYTSPDQTSSSYSGPLVFSPNNLARVRVWARDINDSLFKASQWTPWW